MVGRAPEYQCVPMAQGNQHSICRKEFVFFAKTKRDGHLGQGALYVMCGDWTSGT